MQPIHNNHNVPSGSALNRRRFFTSAASGLGTLALASLLKEDGLLCKETVQHVLRLAPPLMVAEKDLDMAVEKIKKVLA